MQVPDSLTRRLKSFEPSGIVYSQALGQYLIASDDTTKGDDAWLFMMDENGVVAADPLEISGMGPMTDMESISFADDGFLYVLSSQSLNKKGKEKIERNQFARVSVSASGASLVASVELRPLLLSAFAASNEPSLKSLRGALGELNIEAHFIRGGELFVGLKGPQPAPGRGLIVGLGKVDDVFSGKKLKGSAIKVWANLDFKAISGKGDTLSDMTWAGDRDRKSVV